MSEHRLPRDAKPPIDPESFSLNEPELGRSTPMREATDEQLARHLKINIQAQTDLQGGIMQMLNKYTQLCRGVACIEYEIDRRKRTIAIVTDLSTISGLRKQ